MTLQVGGGLGEPRIEVVHSSVLYVVQQDEKAHSNLSGQLFGWRATASGQLKHAIRAIKPVSFTIQSGERVGIIGRNGAGKSTLLKMLAGVVRPWEGLVSVKGLVQGLFDIGIGWEVEATGRENIFFRSLIQGLSPEQAREREEEIIAFSGLGAFVDRPVKTYSSGMTVRLVFAIATYLEGNILLIDEIFGAGDNDFQERAVARMHDILSRARIVVFTSHNLSLVSEICQRGLWLDGGELMFDGPIDEAIARYLEAYRRN
jgi:lipopolysaccharide transport system ATP-binding protein